MDFALKRLVSGALLLVVLLTACTPSQTETPSPSPVETPATSEAADYARLDIFAMDTVMTLQVYGPNAEENVSAVSYEINRLERDLSVTRETSDIWKVNHSGGAPVQVCEDAIYLAQLAEELGDRTGGALDVTMYPVVKAWGFTTGDYRIPEETELQALLKQVDYSAVDYHKIEDMVGAVVTLPQGMELDLGSIA